MAVWGAPVAREDDAERAVRAALDLVAAVTNLGDRLGLDLRLRVGVLTGEAAVDIAGVGEGMVQGDAVNTAARLQSIADPGTVFVDDVTRLATERAIVYQDAGTHVVKGKSIPVQAWRPMRIVATVGGAGRPLLELPLVGRRAELDVLRGALDRLLEPGAGLDARVGCGRGRTRQVAPGLGAREVRGRSRRARAVASRPSLEFRRGNRLPGPWRHGPHESQDHARGLSGHRTDEARRAPRRRVRQRCPGPRSRRAGAPPPAGTRRRQRADRPRRAVLRVALAVRAPGRPPPGAAPVRGPPLGRSGPVRLHRSHGRLGVQVADSDPRAQSSGRAARRAQPAWSAPRPHAAGARRDRDADRRGGKQRSHGAVGRRAGSRRRGAAVRGGVAAHARRPRGDGGRA